MRASAQESTAGGARQITRGGLVLLVALSFGWGLFWPLMKVSLGELPLLTFRALCAELGGAILLLIAGLSGMQLRVPRREIGPLVLLALFGTTGWLYFSALGVQMMGSGRAALIAYTMPLWAFLLGVWILGERPEPRRWIGLATGIAGVLALVVPDLSQAQEAPLGIVVLLLTAWCWASGSVLIKRFRWTIPTPALAGWQTIIGGLPLAVAALLTEMDEIRPISGYAAFAVAYNIVIGVAFGVYAWFRVVQMVPLSVASLAILAVPVVGLVSSALIVHEPIGPAEIVALVLIVGGMATVLPLPALPWRRKSRLN